MAKDEIKYVATFSTKGCPYESTSGGFNEETIPSNYYNVLNGDDDDRKNINFPFIDNLLPDNKWVEDEMVKNDEGTKDEIIIDNDYSLD